MAASKETVQSTAPHTVPTNVPRASLIRRTGDEMKDMMMMKYWTEATFGLSRVDDLFVAEKLIKFLVRFLILGSIFYMLIAGVSYFRKGFSYPSKYLMKRQLTST